MPTYRLSSPGEPPELLEADSCRVEGAMTVLRGTALVLGRPREIALRRVPASVLVEEVAEEVEQGARPTTGRCPESSSGSGHHSKTTR